MKPINTLSITCIYHIATTSVVALPDGKTTLDIDSCYIKHGSFHCTFKDGTDYDCDLGDADLEAIDWKYPTEVSVFEQRGDEAMQDNDYSESLGL